MKSILTTLFLLVMIAICGQNTVSAQGKSQDNRDKKEKKEKKEKSPKKDKEDREEDDEDDREDDRNDEERGPKKDKDNGPKSKNGEHPGKGNAYGKNKGDLSGREFGQERARQAKMKREELEDSIDENEDVVERGRKTIKDKREKLEADLKSGKIDQAEYQRLSKLITDAEATLLILEKDIDKGKVLLKDTGK